MQKTGVKNVSNMRGSKSVGGNKDNKGSGQTKTIESMDEEDVVATWNSWNSHSFISLIIFFERLNNYLFNKLYYINFIPV